MRLLREPLLHFVLLGGILFGLYSFANEGGGEAPGEIVVTAGQIASLQESFERVWRRPPSAGETEGLIADHIRDEVFYREALAMGLDEDDVVVRRRLREKLEFVAAEIADAEPTDAELKTYIADHPERFLSEPQFSFRHVYFRIDGGAERPESDPKQVLESLRTQPADADTSALGDPFMLGDAFDAAAQSDVKRTFGPEFSEALARVARRELGGPRRFRLRPPSGAAQFTHRGDHPALRGHPRSRKARMAARTAHRSRRGALREAEIPLFHHGRGRRRVVGPAGDALRHDAPARRLAVVLAALIGLAQAHDVRPGYLQITETAPEVYAVRWKVPAMGELRLALYPRFPENAADAAPPESAFFGDAYVERRTLSVPGGLTGSEIGIDGLAAARTDVLVRLEWMDGATQTERLTAARPSFVVAAAAGPGQVAAAYLWLGIEHILFGIDHLLFVLALLILVRGWKRILLTISAFTLAHSITLDRRDARLRPRARPAGGGNDRAQHRAGRRRDRARPPRRDEPRHALALADRASPSACCTASASPAR